MGEEERKVRAQERESLRFIIQQWNSNRLDLFEISEPDENLLFHGVMRFYFQDSGQKVATKCIRVNSTHNTRHVIETLIEKFRPDMRMLSVPEYTLYEIHENGEERRLSEEEKPLLVELNWNKDDREGRFLLRRMDLNGRNRLNALPPLITTPQPIQPASEETFTRKLSRREKKELKKQEKMRRAIEANGNDNSMAEKLYTELPETSFTRSISNPEAVMRRRRAQKLEKKLQQFRSKDGGPDTGGTLKIYGESLCQDVPYKTLLLSVRDTAALVVKEMLEKYGLYREDPTAYCLVQCIVTAEETVDGYQGKIIPQKEYILDDDECPLAILMNHPPSRGSIMFQVRRRPADHGQRRRKKKPLKGAGGHHQLPPRHPHNIDEMLPFLVELGPEGSDLGGKGRHHPLQPSVTEVGTDRSAHTGGQSLQLFGPLIQPRHCVIAHIDGIVTVTPCSRDAETFVNFQRIFETTILQHGSVVRFGRTHNFRFVDPQQDDRLRHHLTPQQMHHGSQYLDRSGHDGKGEPHFHGGPFMQGSHFGGSRASSIAGSQLSIARPPMRVGSELQLRSPLMQEHWNNYDRFGPPRDPILPAVLEFREDVEESFLHSITTQLDPTDIQFKLAPTYTLYMAARFRASTHYRPDLSPTERAQKLTVMLTNVGSIVHQVIEVKQQDPTALAFWMANASELLHFLKQDRHISGYSVDAQDILAEAVQFAFRKLVDYMQSELSSAMPLFLEDRNDRGEEEGCTADVLSLLTNTMALLRRCRVNAALTIQLFSQLFHYVNMWVFNKVVTDNCPNYCSSLWGERLKERLARIELWAEKQGLELAADCHLAKLSQAALLLMSPKSSPDDAASVSSTCFKLNSLQLRELLEKYENEPGEPPIPKDLIESVVSVAETTADGLAREDGREIRLEEESDLQLPFLLPEDGYSCDIVRGVPSGLAEFLEPLQMSQLCRMTPQPTSSGFWTIYMHNHHEIVNQRPPPGPRSPSAMSNRSMSVPRGEPEVHTIQLHKSNSGMGLSIVATKGENQDQLGIYIKSVVSGGAADQDGRLQAGDQLLSVDGKSLVGISQEEAAQYMVGTGPIVTLEVARQGALFHGLAPLLSQPSPQVNNNRVEIRRASHPLDHRKESHRLEDKRRPPLPIPNTVPRLNKPPLSPPAAYTMVNSKSSPNLASKQVPSPGVQDPRREPQPPPNFNQPSYSPSQHPAMQSRMQASKSVPSLNSDSSNANIKGTAPAEGFNQAYSRASSATSLAHNHHYPMRSRSTQNLNEGGPLTLSGRHPSSPSLNNEDDRHYQNVSFHQGPQDPRMGSQRGGRPPMFSTNSGGAPDQRPVSAFMQREDPMQRPSEAMHRPMSQQNIRQDPRFDDPRKRDERVRYNGHHVSHSVPIGPNAGFPHGQMPNSTSNMQMRPQLRGGPLKFAPAFQGQMSPHGPPPGQMSPHGPPPGQMSPHGPPPGQMSPHGPPPGQMSPHGPPPGQMSPHGPPPGQMYPHGPPGQLATQAFYSHSPADNIPPQMSPQYANSPQNKYPPPTAPKPNRGSGSFDAPEKPSRMDAFRPNGPPRPPLPEDGIKRESPPPPPPPTSTHPLLQSPNGGVMREEVRKREAARRWRDEQICVLENQERKTPQEHEKMNTLRLEREFQKRAEAAHREDEEEDDDDEDEDDDPREEIHWGGPPNEGGGRKADEIRRKQQELEAAKEAEERILREAQRRQEEEMRHRHHATKRLDSLLVTSESNGTSPLPPERGSSYSVMHHQSAESKAPPVKRVQFSENSHNITYDNNANHEKNTVREDPNNFINEAELMLNASPNRSGNTPGVIGAQEVYRDPRQRRLLEQAQKAAATRPAGPEKLTFREKMKMFAMETEDSPKDKAKHSKAQREIEQ